MEFWDYTADAVFSLLYAGRRKKYYLLYAGSYGDSDEFVGAFEPVGLWWTTGTVLVGVGSGGNHRDIYYHRGCVAYIIDKIDGRNYDLIKSEGKNIDKIMEAIYSEYIQNAISEICSNIAHLDIITIPSNHKEIIKQIEVTKKMPEKLDRALIASINELFKNFKIVEINREQLIGTLFKKDQLLTLEELRKAFFDWENGVKEGQNEDEIRIKLS